MKWEYSHILWHSSLYMRNSSLYMRSVIQASLLKGSSHLCEFLLQRLAKMKNMLSIMCYMTNLVIKTNGKRRIALCCEWLRIMTLISEIRWDVQVIFVLSTPVAERLRALFLNHSIISPLCLVWVRAPLWPHVRQAKFCLLMCQVVFLGVLTFSPTY